VKFSDYNGTHPTPLLEVSHDLLDVKMISVTLKAVFVMTLLLSAGCTAYMSFLQSPFFAKFSLRELVEKNKSHLGMNCTAGGGGGGIGTGTGGVGRGGSHFHKGESFSCLIDSAEQFDERGFVAALKQTVETELDQSEAKITASANRDASSFYFEYTIKGIRGKVEVSGRKTPGNYYSLVADLDESTNSEAK
jgi:hypothetical protein